MYSENSRSNNYNKHTTLFKCLSTNKKLSIDPIILEINPKFVSYILFFFFANQSYQQTKLISSLYNKMQNFFFVNNINKTDKFCSLMHANFYRHSFSFWGLYVQILQYNYILWWCISTFRIVYITSISYCTLVFDFLFLFIQVSMSN